jgi:hypothetical protein
LLFILSHLSAPWQVLLDLLGLSSTRRGIDIAALCAFVVGSFILNCLVVAAKLHRILPRTRRAVTGTARRRRAPKEEALNAWPPPPSDPFPAQTAQYDSQTEKRASAVGNGEGGEAASGGGDGAATGAVAAARAEVDRLSAKVAHLTAEIDRLRGTGSTVPVGGERNLTDDTTGGEGMGGGEAGGKSPLSTQAMQPAQMQIRPPAAMLRI